MGATFKIHEWYTYENGKYKKTFYCIDIDGEHLMFSRHCGFSLIACRQATSSEIKQAKEEIEKMNARKMNKQ